MNGTGGGPPWLERGNVFAVPVLRHRLSFAVQVRRAFEQLRPDGRDLVAVALPASIAEVMRAAIGDLPKPSIIISSIDRDDHREVFAVTPADGLIEAVRSAGERGVPVSFVDREVLPGHLVDNFCLADDTWPDDDSALRYGALHHLDLVTDRLNHPPSRFEPMDTWRELHMAAQLQRAVGRYRRVIFVANATHIRPVLALLGHPVPPIERGPDPTTPPRYRVWQPSLAILLSYLGSIPRLVELYERQRSTGEAHRFDARQAVVEALHTLGSESADLSISIRRFQAFSHILNRLLDDDRRLSPDFGTVFRASSACFPRVFHNRVFRHFLGYFDLVQVHRIGQVRGSRETVYQVRVTRAASSRPVYVARNCTRYSQSYELVSVPGELLDGEPVPAPDLPDGVIVDLDPPPMSGTPSRREAGDWNLEDWPPAERLMYRMRQKAIDLSRRAAADQRSVEFRGSLLRGVDARRTLRSHARGQPRLYVRQQKPAPTSPLDRFEPVMWLFDGYQAVDASGDHHEFASDFWRVRGIDLLAGWHVRAVDDPVDATDRTGRPMILRIERLAGRVTFPRTGLTPSNIDQWGDRLLNRLPRLAEIDSFEDLSHDLEARFDMAFTPARWWEALLAWGLTHADKGLVLVAPPHYAVPPQITRWASGEHKRIVQISHHRFTTDEVRRLGTYPWVGHRNDTRPAWGPHWQDPAYQQALVEQFGDVMASHW